MNGPNGNTKVEKALISAVSVTTLETDNNYSILKVQWNIFILMQNKHNLTHDNLVQSPQSRGTMWGLYEGASVTLSAQ